MFRVETNRGGAALRIGIAAAFAAIAAIHGRGVAAQEEGDGYEVSGPQRPPTSPRDESPEARRAEEMIRKTEEERVRREREAFEFFRSRVAPNDVIPYLKPNHWSTLYLEMRANKDNYEGRLELEGIPLEGLGREIVYARNVGIAKGQRESVGLPVMVPDIRNREITFSMRRGNSNRPDLFGAALVRRLEPHQMLILALTPDPSSYEPWRRFQAMMPVATSEDPQTMDRVRYYQPIAPNEKPRALLSPHPLAWTMISHVVWDNVSPSELSLDQQQAMLDWLNWGGQLIVVAAPGRRSLPELADSFLGPYLPATTSGATIRLTEEDLDALAKTYRPPRWPTRFGMAGGFPPPGPGPAGGLPGTPGFFGTPPGQEAPSPEEPEEGLSEDDRIASEIESTMERFYRDRNLPHYYLPTRIPRIKGTDLFLGGLEPRPGATSIPLGEGSDRTLAVERRVGRGRIVVIGLDPNARALALWRGRDTLIRRVLLRRPEDPASGRGPQAQFQPLGGSSLTWSFHLSRDVEPGLSALPPDVLENLRSRGMTVGSRNLPLSMPDYMMGEDERAIIGLDRAAVGGWLDDSGLPRRARDALTNASGIRIPNSRFIGRILLAYIAALVPLNWLICRFAFRRPELAWLTTPIIAMGFALFVERGSAFDLGYTSASDEISTLEIQPGYDRAHLTRFGSLTTTDRAEYALRYPNDPTALALPMNAGQGVRGQAAEVTTFDADGAGASLTGYAIQPRSVALFRAEQMVNLGGTIRVDPPGADGTRRVFNDTPLPLRSVRIVDVANERMAVFASLPAGGELTFGESDFEPIPPPPPPPLRTRRKARPGTRSREACTETRSERSGNWTPRLIWIC